MIIMREQTKFILMKVGIIMLTTIVFTGCLGGRANVDINDGYLSVNAKRKIYHQDGSYSYSEYQSFKTRTIDQLLGYSQSTPTQPKSKFGGLLSQRADSTGFFHVKRIKERWWCIDPAGYYYVNVGFNNMIGTLDSSMKPTKAISEITGNRINIPIEFLQENGFNCAGSWYHKKAIINANKTNKRPMAYTINWDFMSRYGRKRGGTFQQHGHTGYPNDAIFVFDPEFEVFCDNYAKKILETRNDPNLFGHFSDNEMPFKLSALDNYLALPSIDPGYQAAKKWLIEQGITSDQITDSHREAFMALVAEKYFSIVSHTIKKYDPNHMYLGTRFYANEKNNEAFMRAAGSYIDIISTNYSNCWTPDSALMSRWTKWSGRPFLVTEYYAKGEGSEVGNASGASWVVKTQKDRGLFYQNFNLALIESKNCVGWHYFIYQDNELNKITSSDTNGNKGIVNEQYVEWKPMMEKMKEFNTQVYSLIEYFDSKD